MRLERLTINRNQYGKHKGRLAGQITISGESGAINMNIRPEHAEAIIAVCASALVDTAKEAANVMVGDLIEAEKLAEIANAEGE